MKEALLSPQMTIKHFTAGRDITVNDIGVAPFVVISWGRRVIPALAERIDAQPSEHWFYGERQPFFTGKVGQNPVCLVEMPVGAPGTIMIMEEMIAAGANTFLALGWAGSLQSYAPMGTFIVPTACVREEGTSAHYLDGDEETPPDESLVKLIEATAEAEGEKVLKGSQWTTDAPYRELRSKVEAYRRQGVLGVDMETTAMYALGSFRKVKVCNLLVISDELGEEWRQGFGTDILAEATKKAERIILGCLATIDNTRSKT